MRPNLLLLVLLAPLLFFGCQATSTAPFADSDQVWRDNLPELAKGHSDKVKLGLYAGSFLRKLDPSVKAFVSSMYDENKRLAARLAAWAKKNDIDLKFHFGKDVPGKARAALEKDDGNALQADADVDFQRDMLRYMASDYDWQRHLIAALIPHAHDPELKAYLEDSLQVHNQQYAQILELLKHYQWNK